MSDRPPPPPASAPSAGALRKAILADPSIVLNDTGMMRALIDARQPEDGRKIVDLQGVLINRLETRLDRLTEAHSSMIENACDNMAGMAQVHRACLAALDPAVFEDFLTVVTTEFPALLHVDVVRFCIETSREFLGPAYAGEAGDEEPLVAVEPGAIAAYMALGSDRPDAKVILRESFPEADLVFGAAARRVRSEALIHLDFGRTARPGLLVFGAEDPNRFHPDQGADLLAFLGGVIERAMRHWLASVGVLGESSETAP